MEPTLPSGITHKTVMQKNASKTKTGIFKTKATKMALRNLFSRKIKKKCFSIITRIMRRAIKAMNRTPEKLTSSKEAATRLTTTSRIHSISSTAIRDRGSTTEMGTTNTRALKITASKHKNKLSSATCNLPLRLFLKITPISRLSQTIMAKIKTRSRVSLLLHSSQHQRLLLQLSSLSSSSMKKRLMKM